MSERGLAGQRIVLTMYAILVAAAGFVGVMLALLVDNLRPPSLLFLVQLPPTPLGMAVYGMVTVALAFGLPLALVIGVTRRFDLDEPENSHKE